MNGVRLGIDLGGTKIEGALLHPDGRLAPRIRIPTPQGDYHATLDAIAGLVGELASAHPGHFPRPPACCAMPTRCA